MLSTALLGLLPAIVLSGPTMGSPQESEPVASQTSSNYWEPLTPMHVQRMESGCARVGNFVYVVGGLIADHSFIATNIVEVYDLESGEWSLATYAPMRLHHVPAAAWGRNLYIVGGWTGFHDARRRTFVYDTDAGAWSQKSLMPEKRAGHAMVAHGGKLYVFGGVDDYDNPQRSTFIYDIASDTWTRGLDMPTPRDHVTAAVVDDSVFVLGGRIWGTNTPANERLDLSTLQWHLMAPMPTPRSATITAALGTRVYVGGGELPVLYDVVEVYDAEVDRWETIEPMDIPRHGVQAVSLGERILVPGGGDVVGLSPSTHVDQFVLASAVHYASPSQTTTR